MHTRRAFFLLAVYASFFIMLTGLYLAVCHVYLATYPATSLSLEHTQPSLGCASLPLGRSSICLEQSHPGILLPIPSLAL